jgi:hypothetical protein
MPSPHSLWIGDSIAGEALFEILGFSDVNDLTLSISHLVNAGLSRELLEKSFAQPLDQRLLWLKQELLTRRHGGENTPIETRGKFFVHAHINSFQTRRGES